MTFSLATEQGKTNTFYLVIALFVVASSVASAYEFYYLWGLPIVVTVIGVALFKLDWLLLGIVFFTPLSQNLEKLEFGLGIYLPTEPLMFGAMLFFFAKVVYDWKYDMRILKHPLSIAVLLNLVWIFICVFPSELPLVSFKFFVSRMWFVVPFYFMAIILFKDRKNRLAHRRIYQSGKSQRIG